MAAQDGFAHRRFLVAVLSRRVQRLGMNRADEAGGNGVFGPAALSLSGRADELLDPLTPLEQTDFQ